MLYKLHFNCMVHLHNRKKSIHTKNKLIKMKLNSEYSLVCKEYQEISIVHNLGPSLPGQLLLLVFSIRDIPGLFLGVGPMIWNGILLEVWTISPLTQLCEAYKTEAFNLGFGSANVHC